MKKCFLLIALLISSISFAQNEYQLAENYYREGAFEKATEIYKKLYEKSSFNTSYLKKLISCYQETNNFFAVEKLLKARLKKNSSEVYLYVFLGYNYQRNQQKEDAEHYYQKALKAIDSKPHYAYLVADTFNNYTLLDHAIIAYKKAMTHNPKANYDFKIAQIYGEKGDFEKMYQSYINLVDKNPNYISTVKRFVSRYITDDSENKQNILFRKTLLRKSASQPKDIWNVLLSWLFTQQKDYRKAFIQQKALYQRNPQNLNSIFSIGTIAFEQNSFEDATSIFDFIIDKTDRIEEKINAHFYLASIAIKTQQSDVATLFKTLFQQFGKNKKTLKLQVLYADYLTFQKNNPIKAVAVLEEAIRYADSKFEIARIQLKLGDVLVFRGQYNKALIYFSKIQTKLKNHPLAQEARFKVAQTSYFKGDFSWSKAQLKVLKGATTQLIANNAVDLYLTITDNEPVDSIPSGLVPYAKAELLAFQNKDTEAITVLNEVLTDFKGQPIEDEALFKQAKLFIKQQKLEEAVANFKKVIALNPEGILIDDAHYQLAELYYKQLNNPEKAQTYYQKIIFDFPSSIYLVDARKKFRKLRGDKT